MIICLKISVVVELYICNIYTFKIHMLARTYFSVKIAFVVDKELLLSHFVDEEIQMTLSKSSIPHRQYNGKA